MIVRRDSGYNANTNQGTKYVSLISIQDLIGSSTTDYTVPAMEVDLNEARSTFETNFFSVILMCKTFLPLLMKSKGTIVQVGSIAGVSIS